MFGSFLGFFYTGGIRIPLCATDVKFSEWLFGFLLLLLRYLSGAFPQANELHCLEDVPLVRSEPGARTGQSQIIYNHQDGTRAELFQYSVCLAELAYVLIEGHGNAWPGAGPRLQRLLGPATQEVDAAVLAWWFFSNL